MDRGADAALPVPARPDVTDVPGRWSLLAPPLAPSARLRRAHAARGRGAVRRRWAATLAALRRPAMPAPAIALPGGRLRAAGMGDVGRVLARVEAAALSPAGSPASRARSCGTLRDSERPELSRRIPAAARRLLDVGCGSGATSAALRRRDGRSRVTGLEIDPVAAARARAALDRVIVGDAAALLAALAAAGERFDAFLIGDVLEHTADPVALLAAARAASDRAPPSWRAFRTWPSFHRARPAARPVRSRSGRPGRCGTSALVHSRFLAQCLEEAGWRVEEIAGERAGGGRIGEVSRVFCGLARRRWIGGSRGRALSASTSGSPWRGPVVAVRSRVRCGLRISSTRRRSPAASTSPFSRRRRSPAGTPRRRRLPRPRARWFPWSRARFERSSFADSRELASADVRVATFWTTVAPALAGAAGPVFHLSQGYEAAFSFYAGQRDRIEAAYRLPTRKLAISETLAARLEAAGHGPVENVGQAFDPAPFFPGTDAAALRGDRRSSSSWVRVPRT